MATQLIRRSRMTVLHVFIDKSEREFFTRTKSNREVPQVRIDLDTLPENFSANIPLARPGRCQAPLRNLPEDQVVSILDAAAQFRLDKRRRASGARSTTASPARTIVRRSAVSGMAAALGYKENKLPFTLLAQRLPLKFLRETMR